MRKMRIWRASDGTVYAKDDTTGEEFWFAPYQREVGPEIAEIAIARLLQEQLTDFADWLKEDVQPAA